jgi:hypothetical protein
MYRSNGGPSERVLSRHRRYIAEHGDIDYTDPMYAYDLGNGKYLLQNGHHRLKVANEMNIKTIRIKVIKFPE